VPLGQVARAALPLVAVAMAALLFACFWPPLITWFPSLIYH
jgi:TRAP-type C4-dicarboxylate transport system permease large subunit